MTDREAELRDAVAGLRDHERVVDAFVAKSFTDLLVVLDCDGQVPESVRETLAERDVRPADDVYGPDADPSFTDDPDHDGVVRHHFVDTRTRGQHQSYVVE